MEKFELVLYDKKNNFKVVLNSGTKQEMEVELNKFELLQKVTPIEHIEYSIRPEKNEKL